MITGTPLTPHPRAKWVLVRQGQREFGRIHYAPKDWWHYQSEIGSATGFSTWRDAFTHMEAAHKTAYQASLLQR